MQLDHDTIRDTVPELSWEDAFQVDSKNMKRATIVTGNDAQFGQPV